MNRRGADRIGPSAMSGMTALWGTSSLIRSVQAGSITIAAGATSNTATITAVDVANAFVVFEGVISSSGSDGQTDPSIFFSKVVLTNATTVTASKTATDVTHGKVIRFTVIEFAPGVLKSVQSGVITNTGALTATATITEVNTAKAWVVYGGHTTSYPTPSMNTYGSQLTLTNATTVTATNSSTAANYTTGYTVLEMF